MAPVRNLGEIPLRHYYFQNFAANTSANTSLPRRDVQKRKRSPSPQALSAIKGEFADRGAARALVETTTVHTTEPGHSSGVDVPAVDHSICRSVVLCKPYGSYPTYQSQKPRQLEEEHESELRSVTSLQIPRPHELENGGNKEQSTDHDHIATAASRPVVVEHRNDDKDRESPLRALTGTVQPTHDGITTESLTDRDSDEQDTLNVSGQEDDRLETSSRSILSAGSVCVKLPGLVFPKSQYLSKTAESTMNESAALNFLIKSHGRLGHSTDEDFMVVKLSDYDIYRPSNVLHAGALTSLDTLQARHGVNELLFDGQLELGGVTVNVQAVPFETLSLGGYGDLSLPTSTDCMWVQSAAALRRNVWYQLAEASTRYERYHSPFRWLVDFTRHFVNYLEQHKDVGLEDFRGRFHQWLEKIHRKAPAEYTNWRLQCNRKDFRGYVCANYEFLWKEAIDVNPLLRKHTIWSESDCRQPNAIKERPLEEHETIVTPYVYAIFKTMYFGSFLKRQALKPAVESQWLNRITQMGFASGLEDKPGIDAGDKTTFLNHSDPSTGTLERGDIIALDPDDLSNWKRRDDMGVWFAYVQGLLEDKRYGQRVSVIWLYQANDTSCGIMKYPFKNELFFSDHCNCGDAFIRPQDVTRKLRARLLFGTDPKVATESSDVFIRQCYLTDDQSFVTLKKKHLVCGCRSPEAPYHRIKREFQVGDSVLAKLPRQELLQPCTITRVDEENGVEVQLFLRRGDLGDPEALANELVTVSAGSSKLWLAHDKIIRKCHIKAFPVEKARNREIPAPYSYEGAADCWVLTGQIRSNGQPGTGRCIESYDDDFAIEEFDPVNEVLPTKLNGLGLFAGGGSFDRGLSEGAAVDFKWAVEWDRYAAHTYRANLRDAEETALFLGSVNDHLAKALQGKSSSAIPTIGNVHFISAGSPCQGFSMIQTSKLSSRSCQNASMVASVVAYVDFYRPAYAIMENVHAMSYPRLGPNKDENVFAQVICALVGMGYQVQQFNVDAWSHGSPQSRSRLFIIVTAPNLTPLAWLSQTHAHPREVRSRNFGKLTNGLTFGERQDDYTPFPTPSAGEATRDLPLIGDGAVESCIFHPDHRVVAQVGPYQYKAIYRHIPKLPLGVGWAYALEKNRMPPAIQEYVHSKRGGNRFWMNLKTNKAYTRVKPYKTFDTITTTPSASDAFTGAVVHWQDDRTLTVLEARRAQTIPDHEVLVGNRASQWKIIGNGVPRTIAVAFGMAFREACIKNEEQDLFAHKGMSCMQGISDESREHTAAQASPARDSSLAPVRSGFAIVLPKHMDSDNVDSETDDARR